MPRTVELHLTLAQPFLVEGGDPTPPWGVMDVLTDAVFPNCMGSGCFDSRRSWWWLSERGEELQSALLGMARQFCREDLAWGSKRLI